MSNGTYIISLFVSFGIGVIFLATVIALSGNSATQYRKAAIERGYAQYCSTTGHWAWKDECDEK